MARTKKLSKSKRKPIGTGIFTPTPSTRRRIGIRKQFERKVGFDPGPSTKKLQTLRRLRREGKI